MRSGAWHYVLWKSTCLSLLFRIDSSGLSADEYNCTFQIREKRGKA
uniref:Uncharacterized protein n=1 Tax=Anguilla anguilla TaxID=7936 RepID=A0A0E9PMC7_ANGAN